ncbi:MAG: hypothetical protein LUE27_09115 [Clostridia bacterium]|nr:hypothetical protein [Clostridia bacterium]
MKIPNLYKSEYRKLNRKLIPANIILLILAVVACLAQILMPLFTVKIDLPEGSVTEVIRTLVEAQEEEDGPDSADDADDAEARPSEEADILDKLDSYFGYMPEFSMEVSFSPLSLVTSPKDDIDAFAEWFAGLFPTGDEMKELAEDVFSPMIGGLVNTEIILMVTGNKINTKFEKIYERTEEDIIKVFTDLVNGDPKQARADYNSYIFKIGRLWLFGVPADRSADEDTDDSDVDYDAIFDTLLAAEPTEEETAQVEAFLAEYDFTDVFDQILEAGEADGDDSTFSMERAISGFFSSTYIAPSAELTAAITSFLTDPSEYMATWFKDMLADTGIEAQIEEWGMSFDAVMIILFVVFCAFPAALWAIMAIAAFTHLFRKNKKVGMWYTKLVCIWPCIIWFILPCVLLAVMPGVWGIEGIFSTISIVIGGSGIITGICYLLMWVVSIFLCFPTKRKLRALKAEIKGYRR